MSDPIEDENAQVEALLTAPQPEKEEPAEEADPLQSFLAEKKLTAEQAREVLERATDEDRQAREEAAARDREAEFDDRFRERYASEGGQLFASELRRKDFAYKALQHIAANHPDLLQIPEQEAEDPDPVAALAKRNHAETAALKAELQRLRDEVSQRDNAYSARAHKEAVGVELANFINTIGPEAERYEDALVEDLHERWQSFRNPAREVPRFLEQRLSRYRRMAGEPAEIPRPKFTPPRSGSGRPGAAPSRAKLPDLSPTGLAREAFAYMRDRGGEE